ncbi:hypothetical protein RHGRI_021043 [Rhododendron griersonianum]|uniref:Uncharacterized protein n=1 Tax=Rhododendron griersonianum TaxID=479676 RepID=A0AAV6JNY4_9ERIC|nr:hypothetical protein RHGRI_021043 [Rhododendron griersonianum]
MTCCFPPIPLDGLPRTLRILDKPHSFSPFKQYFWVSLSIPAFSYNGNGGVLVFLAAKSRFIKGAEEAAEFQNFIICVEMLIAAVGHLYAFSYKEYVGANIGGSCGFTGSLAHALKLNDFYHDTVHQMELEMEMEMLVEITHCHYQSTMDR